MSTDDCVTFIRARLADDLVAIKKMRLDENRAIRLGHWVMDADRIAQTFIATTCLVEMYEGFREVVPRESGRTPIYQSLDAGLTILLEATAAQWYRHPDYRPGWS